MKLLDLPSWISEVLGRPTEIEMLRSKLIERQSLYLRAALPALRVHGKYFRSPFLPWQQICGRKLAQQRKLPCFTFRPTARQQTLQRPRVSAAFVGRFRFSHLRLRNQNEEREVKVFRCGVALSSAT